MKLRGRTGRTPCDEPGRELNPWPVRVWVDAFSLIRQAQEHAKGGGSHFLNGLPDRRQLRCRPSRFGHVIESDHADVPGDVEAEVAHRVVDAEGHHVRCREDGGRPVLPAQDVDGEIACLVAVPISSTD